MSFGLVLALLLAAWDIAVVAFVLLTIADRKDEEKERKALKNEAVRKRQLQNTIEFRHTLDKEALIREWEKIA